MMSLLQKSLLFLLLLFASGLVQAGACTYREAIMAFERGNTYRGMALMQMARKDGDQRASDYLALKGQRFEGETPTNSSRLQSLISLNRADP